MARLPQPGADNGTWGDILNDYLLTSHNADGTLKPSVVTDVNISSSAAIAQAKVANLTTDLAAKETPAGAQAKADAALAQAIPLTQKGAANGVATLTSGGKITPAQYEAYPVLVTPASGSSLTIDLAYNHDITLTASATITLTGSGRSLITFRQDGTGGRTLTISNVVWMGDGAVNMPQAAGAFTAIEVFSQDGSVYIAVSTQHDLRGPSHIDQLTPTGTIAETMARNTHMVNQAFLTSGRLSMTAITLPRGAVISSIVVRSGTTAMVTPSNQWFALFDANRNLLRITADDGANAWSVSTDKQLALNSSYIVPATALYYIGVLVVAGTPPSLWGVGQSASLLGVSPVLFGGADTGLTNPASCPAQATTISAQGSFPYLRVA
jgi:hypothetical protein